MHNQMIEIETLLLDLTELIYHTPKHMRTPVNRVMYGLWRMHANLCEGLAPNPQSYAQITANAYSYRDEICNQMVTR